MRRSCTLFLALSLVARTAGAVDLPELAAMAKPSVALLKVADSSGRVISSGTGFFVSGDGRIVTNHHVIDDAARVTASLTDGRTVDVVGILADDEKRDIAVLQAVPGVYAPLSLGESGSVRVGDEIAIVGSPLGLSESLSAGIVSAIRAEGPTDVFNDSKKDEGLESWGMQVTAAVSHGSSGSPIMNRKGEVVAVAVGKMAGGESVNFGIPVEIPKAMLGSVAPAAAPRPFARGGRYDVLRNLGISGLAFGGPYVVYVVWRKRSDKAQRRARLS